MRWVYAHREESTLLGEHARQSIRRTMDPAITRREILARVEEIDKGTNAQLRR